MGLMNFTGEVLLPIEYNNTSRLDDGYILCEEDNGYEMLRITVKSDK